MMVLCQMTVRRVETMQSRNTHALIPKIGSRGDLPSSLRSKKEKHYSKIRISQLKTQLDGMTSLMQVDLVFHNMREVSIGKESVMSTHLRRATHSGEKTEYRYMILDKVRSEIAGS